MPLSPRVVFRRVSPPRPPEIWLRPPTSPLFRDRWRPVFALWCHMETTTHPSTLLLTLDEAARELRCARRSIERHIARHRLTVVHLGRSVRVERRELERFIAQMRDHCDG